MLGNTYIEKFELRTVVKYTLKRENIYSIR